MEIGMLLGETLLRDLRQPEYIHVLLNPLPVYGLLIGLIGLVLALILKSRRAQIATLTLVLISSATRMGKPGSMSTRSAARISSGFSMCLSL